MVNMNRRMYNRERNSDINIWPSSPELLKYKPKSPKKDKKKVRCDTSSSDSDSGTHTTRRNQSEKDHRRSVKKVKTGNESGSDEEILEFIVKATPTTAITAIATKSDSYQDEDIKDFIATKESTYIKI